MLDKRLTIGGLQVGGPRTAQNPARFRVANNVYQTRDDYMVPRADTIANPTAFTDADSLKHIFKYNDAPFTLGYDGSEYQGYYGSGDKIVTPGLPAPTGSLGIQALEKLGNLYFNFPLAGMFKYDGSHLYRAGVPLPYFSCAQYASAGAVYFRVLQHHIDFQGNIVNSGYVQFRGTPNGSSNIILRTDKGATEIVGQGPGVTGISPVTRQEEPVKLSEGYLSYFYKYVSHVINAGTQDITVQTGGDQNVVVGAYLMVSAEFSSSLSTGLAFNIKGLAHRVKSFTGTTVVLDLLDAKALTTEGQWVTTTFPTVPPVAWPGSLSLGGANYWQTAWASTSATGVYYYLDLFPCFYESAVSTSITIFVPVAPHGPKSGLGTGEAENCAFNIVDNMSETYDVTTEKAVFPYGREGAFPISFSTFDDSALMAYANEVYFSDTSLGGSFEMVNGLSFIVVGEGDDGDVQAVCGSADFFMVSRQFKNYYVAGNLPTANYRVAEIPATSLGVYSNESLIAIGDKIIFLNKQGVWALYFGGKCTELSEFNRGLFDNFAETASFAEELYFDLDAFPTYATNEIDDVWVRPRHDVNRGLLAFIIYDEGKGKALVLNLNNGEFYTWSDLLHSVTDPEFNDLCFIDGSFYLTQNASGVVSLNTEDKTDFDYLEDFPARLSTTWFTAGEPSLEKKLQQVKVWGRVASFDMEHSLDWIETPTIDGTYTNAITNGFSHKRRFTPANFLAVSVQMDFTSFFQIEGVEIEWQPFQEGMKR